MKHWIPYCICISLLLLVCGVAADWEVTISATNQMAPVSFGYSSTPETEYTDPPVMGKVILWLDDLYSREIKSSDLTWILQVSVPDGTDTTLSWDAAHVPGTLEMTGAGTDIDMKSQSTLDLDSGSYSYTITASTGPTPTQTTPPTTIPTTVPTTPSGPDYTLQLYPGWNMISFPEPLQAGKNTALYLNTYVDPASHSMWRYNAQTAQYEQMLAGSVLTPLEGYWLYSNADASVPLYFDPGSAIVSKQLYTGWNMIGFAGTVPTTADDMLSSITGSWDYVFGYDAQTQRFLDQVIPPGTGSAMTPGSGYWLYVHETCLLSA